MPHARCWLCERSETEDAKNFHAFAIKYAPTVDSRSMAASFHDTLQEKRGDSSRRGYRRLHTEHSDNEDALSDGEVEPGKRTRRERSPDAGGADAGGADANGSDAGGSDACGSDGESDAGESEADACACEHDGEEHDEVPSIDEIYAHLSLHVLHPTVRVSHALRGLVELSETLRDLTVTRGEDGESPLVDVRTVTMYLKVTSEIMQIYRSADPSKMLFGGQETR